MRCLLAWVESTRRIPLADRGWPTPLAVRWRAAGGTRTPPRSLLHSKPSSVVRW